MRISFPLLALSTAVLSAQIPHAAAQSPAAAPLPDPHQLLLRALDNEKKLAAEQERYECRVISEIINTDKNGKVKKTTTETKDQFYVNGVQIERTLAKDGKDLSADKVRKEDERVMKQTVKYSDKATAAKESAKQDRQAEDLLTAMMLTNGHREEVNGRSVLAYTIVPNPKFQPRNMNQHLATVLQGTISIDEQTGEMIDLNVKSQQDLKIAGGVLANLHKGFWIHLHQQPQPDGVWLTDLVEGSGDARAMLFIHPFFRFRQTLSGCHLYTTSASQVGKTTVLKQ